MEIEKWAIYARVSTDREEQRTSVPNQVKYCTEWIFRQGGVVFDTYKDDGISGKSMLIRPEVQRLLADAAAGKITGVVFNNISRFGRDALDLLLMKREMVDKGGLRIVALEEGYDSNRDDDEMLFIIHSGMSQSMRKKLSKQIKHNCMEKARRGEWPLPVPPYGYTRPRKTANADGSIARPADFKLRINRVTAPVVDLIYKLNEKGYGGEKIRQALTLGREPFTAPVPPPPGASQWHKTTILDIIKNPVYKGTVIFNKGTGSGGNRKNDPKDYIIRDNAHPAIIEPDRWERNQEILAKRRGNYGLSPDHALLIGLVRCGKCGYAMRYEKKDVISSRKNRTYNHYEYYQCAHQYMPLDVTKPPILSFRAEILEELVLNWIERLHANPRLVDDLVKEHMKLLRSKSKEGAEELKTLEKEIAKVERNFKKDLELYRAGAITIEDFTSLQEENKLAKENLMRRRALLEQANVLQDSLESRLALVKSILADFAKVDKDNKAELKPFLNRAIESVIVSSSTKVEFNLKHLDFNLPEVPLFLAR